LNRDAAYLYVPAGEETEAAPVSGDPAHAV